MRTLGARRAIRSVVALVPTIACLFTGAIAARAQGGAEQGSHGLADWILYGGPEIGMYGHSAKATSTSTSLTGPRVGNPNATLGDLGTLVAEQQRSRELVMAFLAGATFGGLTPALDVPGRPRLFVDLNLTNPPRPRSAAVSGAIWCR